VSFVPLYNNQQYCDARCRARAGWLRWNERNGRAKEQRRYERDRDKRLVKSKRLKLQKALAKVTPEIQELRALLYDFRGWQKRIAMAKRGPRDAVAARTIVMERSA
jgi:hypothetical protein